MHEAVISAVKGDEKNAQNSGYRETISAHRSATVIARNFAFVQSGYIDPQIGRKVDPTVENLARLIDYATNFPVVVPVVKWFTRNFHWYDPPALRRQEEYSDDFIDWMGTYEDKHQRLEDELERVRWGVRQLEVAKEQMPETSRHGHLPSAAGWSAGHLLERHFNFKPLTPRMAQFWKGARTLGLIVDTTGGIARVEEALNRILTQTSWEQPSELMRNIERLRKAMRLLETAHNRLPDRTNGNGNGHVIKEIPHRDAPVVHHKRSDIADLSRRLANAASPEVEQRILAQWAEYTRRK